MNIDCRKCGRNLPPGRYEKNRKTCRSCRQDYKAKYIKTCEFCEKEFRTAKKRGRFCNAKCFSQTRVDKVKRDCAYCGKQVEMVPSVKEKNTYSYCNQDCRTRHMKITMVGENNPNYQRIEKCCDGCGKVTAFRPFLLKSLRHNFCSYECYKRNIGKFYSGSNNPNWNHTLTKEDRLRGRRYPEYYKWRSDVFKRDNHTCQCCGSSESGKLNAHHIENYSSNKSKRTDLDNGITLCVNCHVSYHKEYGYFKNTPEQLIEFFNIYQGILI